MKKIKQFLENYRGYFYIAEIIGYSFAFSFTAYVLFNFAFLFRP